MSDRTQIIATAEEQEDPPAGSNMKEQMYAAATEAAQFLRAIGSEQRLMILCVLMEGRKTVTEICLATGSRQSLVSQHLTRLRLDGLVEVERQGHFAYYTMNDPLVRDIVSALHRRFCAQGNITSA
ncbi:MAG: ArsR/SmtB family transcription factor [Hyphomicrobiaceae bacterium]